MTTTQECGAAVWALAISGNRPEETENAGDFHAGKYDSLAF